MRLEILPVLGIGDVTEGDDLAAVIATAAPWLRDGDVLVVTSKIVSKAEGRLVDVPADGPERLAARDEVLAGETARVVASRGATRIVQTHHGFVMASAGIDASNVDKTRLVLLPKDPDASARALRAALRERYLDVAVIISDTMGRPWRNGLTDVALGVAGMPAIRDHRGEIDPYGNELQLTQLAVVDELAGAGELIKGKCDQVPVAVVRGYPGVAGAGDGEGARALVRDAELDLFSLGTAEARAAGLREAATLADGPGPTAADPAAVDRAIAAVTEVVAPGTVFTHVTDEEVRAGLVATVPGWPERATGLVLGAAPTPVDPADLVRFGADLQRLRTALAAEGVPSALLPPPTGSTASAALAI
ncbi:MULTISPECIES: coenzyme F420-0:L-glutamate ligase [Micromonospora]|uniref:Coenzyme F420-0:L-glutamate ligase n=1 Tax=Micromonospora solifontis TaxID=2487138 RepID=A0ABX9WJF0_9ACTN|nr:MULTISPECIES: coenzyme F420-0:L-glutamate ligase [Micromonospora]NES15227.1 coenzyme F420-0:L-glutamate ligase [Micromonospora sp. PPF5-17B]NES36499.1 coenzyme F420-0:L-glutamate ligase [Micromonospora solifontis]NES56357.1 coenzyme F420-0:L-glutamate ligase [Micromonospora sp. PPF5-6]RNL99391.1 coenzyme F420-0:L-glutamate ligase [Micromonospora solifontis]